MPLKKFDDSFCSAFLRSMDPERAALDSGCPGEGFAKLAQKHICARLDKMRDDASSQLRREDVVRRLSQLAFGRANDVVKLALHPQDIDPMSLDLSAVSEIRVSDRGGVEIKLVDRVRALDSLCNLLEASAGQEAQQLYQALNSAAADLDWEA